VLLGRLELVAVNALLLSSKSREIDLRSGRDASCLTVVDSADASAHAMLRFYIPCEVGSLCDVVDSGGAAAQRFLTCPARRSFLANTCAAFLRAARG
jgi:hypothetical protein